MNEIVCMLNVQFHMLLTYIKSHGEICSVTCELHILIHFHTWSAFFTCKLNVYHVEVKCHVCIGLSTCGWGSQASLVLASLLACLLLGNHWMPEPLSQCYVKENMFHSFLLSNIRMGSLQQVFNKKIISFDVYDNGNWFCTQTSCTELVDVLLTQTLNIWGKMLS